MVVAQAKKFLVCFYNVSKANRNYTTKIYKRVGLFLNNNKTQVPCSLSLSLSLATGKSHLSIYIYILFTIQNVHLVLVVGCHNTTWQHIFITYMCVCVCVCGFFLLFRVCCYTHCVKRIDILVWPQFVVVQLQLQWEGSMVLPRVVAFVVLVATMLLHYTW